MNFRKGFILVLPSVLMLTSCSLFNSENKTNNKQIDNCKISMNFTGNVSFTDSSMIYISDDSILHYFDIESGFDTVICSKANCKHKGESSTNPDPDCDGYVEGIDTRCMAIYNDNLYFVYTPKNNRGDSGFSYKKLCRAEKDGTGRKDIAEIANAQDITAGYYNSGYLTMGYSNIFDDKGNDLEQSQSYVSAIDLSDGKVIMSPVKKGYNGLIKDVYFADDVVTYAFYSLSENVDFNEYDTASEEFSEYIGSITKTEIIQFNINTKEESVIWSGKGTCESIDYDYVCIDDNGPVIIRLSDKKTYSLDNEYMNYTMFVDSKEIIISDFGKLRYCIFDFDTESVKEIGEISESNYMIICAVTDNKLFVEYYNDSKFALGYIDKKEFYNGNFDKVKFIKFCDES